jgi:hypothetical protein
MTCIEQFSHSPLRLVYVSISIMLMYVHCCLTPCATSFLLECSWMGQVGSVSDFPMLPVLIYDETFSC